MKKHCNIQILFSNFWNYDNVLYYKQYFIGFPANQIVYDSPVKTIKELETAINNGFYINLDNEQEVSQG